MKKMKKIFALLIAMVMVLGMSTSVFAAGDGTITIQNTVKDKTYTVYKVFDATYSGDKVAYSYDGSNTTFLTALQAETSPFNCVANTSGSYTITVKDGIEDSDILMFIKGQGGNFGSAVATKTGDGKTQVVSGLDYGYYYITTNTGSAVTIDSAVKDVTVVDKNEVIEIPEKTEFVNTVDVSGEGTDATTANIGDKISYKVTGNITRYEGEDLVTTMTFTDTMSNGLTPNKDLVIKVTSANGVEKTLVAGTDYTVTYSNSDRTMAIVLTTATVADGVPTFLYETGSTYLITYSAVVNDDAVIAGDGEGNTVGLVTNNGDKGSDSTNVKTYQITLTKTDKDGNKLKDAKFKLYDAVTGGNEIPVVAVTDTDGNVVAGQYRHALSTETGVEMVTPEAGVITIIGLANGTYYFEETEAPEGYNKLTARTEATTITNANATITVLNQAGTELPSTGGIGTTIFYIIGAVLVIGAGVILVTRRRMNAN